VVGGASHAVITGNRVVGIGGDALYTAAVAPPRADYSVRFSVIPPTYDTVPTATTIFVSGRADAAGVGYRARVSADGTQYSLSVTVGATVHATVAMGTLASGTYTAWLVLRGTTIAAQVQRSQDGLWLRGDGTWQASSGTTAAQFSDTTYAAPGLVAIGGTWPVPAAPLIATLETQIASDPNFPTGYISDEFVPVFDFTRNWHFASINGGGNHGIAITDLTTMQVLSTTTAAQMFAGTAFGPTPGVPYSDPIIDIAAGKGSALYLISGDGDIFHRHLVRVDVATMKVTGDFYGPGIPGVGGVAEDVACHR
jgi:hypothetical protein